MHPKYAFVEFNEHVFSLVVVQAFQQRGEKNKVTRFVEQGALMSPNSSGKREDLAASCLCVV